MGATFSKDQREPVPIGPRGRLGILTGTISFDSSYNGGGEVSGLKKYFRNVNCVKVENAGGYFFEYDKANDKVKAMVPLDVVSNSTAQGADNTLLGVAGDVEISGNGSAFQHAGNEVSGGTDLSSVSTRLMIIGEINA